MRKVLGVLAAVAAAVVVVVVIAEPFASNPARAALGELRFEDCFASDGADGCADPSPNSTVLASAQDVAVSPDGKSVYVGGGMGLSHFNRSADGALSYADCVQNSGINECADPSPGKTPLSGPKHVAVSSDGESVYVTAAESNSLSRFDRNTTTGALTFADCFANAADAAADGCTSLGNNPLSVAAQVAVSPDGKNVYVTASGSDSLSRFDRNTTTGALSFAGCFANGGSNGCTDPGVGDTPLDGAWDVAVSPDGKSVYVTSPGLESGSISRFNRDTTTGSLAFADCIGGGGCDESLEGDPLNGPEGLSVSPDGKSVYVAGAGADSIGTFNRATDGSLTFADCFANEGGSECTDPKSGSDPLGGAWDVVVSPDGEDVYLASIEVSSVSRFKRATDGSLTFRSCIADSGASGCATASPGSSPLTNPRGIAVSPDSRNVYVAALSANSISRFAVAVPAAPSSGVLFWANHDGNKISFTNLDGSGGGDLNTGAATVDGPGGLVIDSAAGRVYWLNRYAPDMISYANLDGSGGGDIGSPGTSLSSATGMAIDPAAQRIYWGEGSVRYVGLDGSGGGTLNMSGASPGAAHGVVIDTPSGRIYWAVGNYNRISYANLDGSGGGGDLDTTGGTVEGPEGVAIDRGAGKIYWANRAFTAPAISFAKLSGGSGGTLSTAGATAGSSFGVAIDPVARAVFWGDYYTDEVSYANLDGGGGADLTISGATVDGPIYPILLKAPLGSGAPAVSGGSTVGSTLSCSQGSWAPDLLGAFLYRAPQTFAYQWSRDGAGIAGATASSHAATVAGQYSCAVTASNRAGSASQTSAPFTVSEQAAPPPPPSNSFSFGKVKLNKKKGTAKLTVKVPGPGKLALSGKKVVKQSMTVKKAGNVKLLVKPKGSAKNKLAGAGKAKVKVKVAFTPTGGAKKEKSKTIKLVKNLG